MEIAEQIKSLGTELSGQIGEFKTELEEIKDDSRKIHRQLDAVDALAQGAHGGGGGEPNFEQFFMQDEGIKRLLHDRRGKASVTFKGLADFERKTTITSTAVGSSTSGVLMHDRTAGIVPAARKKLFLGNLFRRIPTEFNAVDYVRVDQDVVKASPQIEASAKFENALHFVTAVANVRTIATWIPASKQILQDLNGLAAFIEASLSYAVKLEEEHQLIAGDNTGENLNGLITQATAFNTGLLVASDGWEYADVIGRVLQQLETANEIEASFVVLPPAIWWSIRLQKATDGQYIYGNPATGDGAFNLFGLIPIRSNVIAANTFLIGSSEPSAAVIRERLELIVEISTEHSDYFTKNLVAIRAEERIALVVHRPASFIKGTFSQSPA